jgi:hypothetical protein
MKRHEVPNEKARSAQTVIRYRIVHLIMTPRMPLWYRSRMSTASFANTSTAPQYFLYVYGSGNSNPLSAVQVGWYAQGPGIINLPVIGIVDSTVSYRIEVSTNQFQQGTSYYFTQSPLILCFNENTKISCLKDSSETSVAIQDLRKGDLVKTIDSGYLKVSVVAKSTLTNCAGSDRNKNKMYKCSKEKYGDLTDDLYITGGHSILVNTVSLEEQGKIKKSFGRLFTTGRKYRLMAFIDENATPCEEEEVFSIYHFALENDEVCYNYGIYANGLLVESCIPRNC